MSVRLRRPLVLAVLLVFGAVGANLAFLGLGKVFDYPAVLDDPPAEVLASFAAHRPAVIALFALLALSAGVLAPIAVLLGRRARTPSAGRAIVFAGVAAAAVQVVGLLRWPLIVPFVHDADTFDTLNLVLGRTIGETLGSSARPCSPCSSSASSPAGSSAGSPHCSGS